MEFLLQPLVENRVAIVAGGVFLDQVGVPLPAYPIIVLAASTAAAHGEALWPIVAAATLATLSADMLWYVAGRKFGSRILATLCRISLTPSLSVIRTRDTFNRWGARALLIAKFAPGFSAIATALSGEAMVGLRSFFIHDTIGTLAWVGIPIVLGASFTDSARSLVESGEFFAAYVLASVAVVASLGLHLKIAEARRKSAESTSR